MPRTKTQRSRKPSQAERPIRRRHIGKRKRGADDEETIPLHALVPVGVPDFTETLQTLDRRSAEGMARAVHGLQEFVIQRSSALPKGITAEAYLEQIFADPDVLQALPTADQFEIWKVLHKHNTETVEHILAVLKVMMEQLPSMRERIRNSQQQSATIDVGEKTAVNPIERRRAIAMLKNALRQKLLPKGDKK